MNTSNGFENLLVDLLEDMELFFRFSVVYIYFTFTILFAAIYICYSNEKLPI